MTGVARNKKNLCFGIDVPFAHSPMLKEGMHACLMHAARLAEIRKSIACSGAFVHPSLTDIIGLVAEQRVHCDYELSYA